MSKGWRKRKDKKGKFVNQQTKEPAKQPASQVKLLAGLIVAVCVAVAIAHRPALSARATCFDDDQYLTENLLVQNPSWASARRFLTEVLEPSTVRGYYQPLTMISLMIDYALGGREENLMPFHRTSLLLHMANTALIIVLLYLLFGQVWPAAAAGLLFGVHPMTVEPTAWVGERKTLLAAFFALWCLVLYVQYARKNNWKLLFGSLVMYVLALMSKPTSTPLPVLMLLMDYWPLRRLNKKAILEKIPFFVIGAISAGITYISQNRTASITSPRQYGPKRIQLVLCHNIIFYLHKIIWPTNLSSHYAFPKPFVLSNPTVLVGVIGTCILVPLLVISLRWTRAAFTGWLFFFVAISPTMGIIGFTNIIASDKFAYLPAFGLLMILTSLLGWFYDGTGRIRARYVVAMIVVLVLAGAQTVATRRHLAHWRDTIGLYEYMLTQTPDAVPVRNNLGNILVAKGKLDRAVTHFNEALRVKPDFADAHNNLAFVLEKQGKLDQAVTRYRHALQFAPNDAKAHNNLGRVLLTQGKLNEAVYHFRRALDISPYSVEAHYNLGLALKSQGKFDEVVYHLQQAIQIKPDYLEAYVNLGSTLAAKGKFDQAISYFQQALKIQPDSVKAHYNLGIARRAQGRFDEAINHFRQAIRLKPDFVEAHNNLGSTLAAAGKLDLAVSRYRRALQIDPGSAKAHYNLAVALKVQGVFDEAGNHFRRALQLKPDFVQAYNNLGTILAEQGKFDEAIDYYRQALKVKPDSAEAHNNLGYALIKQGRFDLGINHYRQALQLRPNWPVLLNSVARILATHPDPKLRDTAQAIALAERAAGLTNYQNASVLDTLAAAYAAAGRFDLAVTTAEKALSLASGPQADYIRKQLELYKKSKP